MSGTRATRNTGTGLNRTGPRAIVSQSTMIGPSPPTAAPVPAENDFVPRPPPVVESLPTLPTSIERALRSSSNALSEFTISIPYSPSFGSMPTLDGVPPLGPRSQGKGPADLGVAEYVRRIRQRSWRRDRHGRNGRRLGAAAWSTRSIPAYFKLLGHRADERAITPPGSRTMNERSTYPMSALFLLVTLVGVVLAQLSLPANASRSAWFRSWATRRGQAQSAAAASDDDD